MNTASFAGNVGNVRFNTVNGHDGPKSVLNFSLAVAKRQKVQDGKPLTLWVDCAVWGKRADALQQYIQKGTKLAVSGSVDVEIFTKDDGQSIPKMTMFVNDLTLQGDGSGGQQASQRQSQTAQQSAPVSGGPGPENNFGDGIPFALPDLWIA